MASAWFDNIDEVTLARARRGDRTAFAALYDRYSMPAFNLALRMLGERAAAEDVVQDVFVRLFSRLRGFRGDAPFGAWLRRLVANAAIDEMRRRRWLESETAVPAAAFPATAALAETQVEAWQALMQLAPAARAVLVLHEIEGYTHQELGALFGRSESYSKSILSRALASLRGAAQRDAEDIEDIDHATA